MELKLEAKLETCASTLADRLNSLKRSEEVTFEGEMKFELHRVSQEIDPVNIYRGLIKIKKPYSLGTNLSIKVVGEGLGKSTSANIDTQNKWEVSHDRNKLFADYRHSSWPSELPDKRVYIIPNRIVP